MTAPPPSDRPASATRLLAVIAAAEPRLAAIPDATAARRPAPNKWSPKEIIGHLIDSASNNHQRFVRPNWEEDLVFPTYAQEKWVALQDYQHAPWNDLVILWASYNRHLARVMKTVPEPIRSRPRARHNLDQIAWRIVPATEPATLEYVMADYVGHLEHHLRQVLGPAWSDTVASGIER